MERFNKIYDGETVIHGAGFYERVNMDYYIETDNSEVISYFKSKVRNKQHLKMLELTNGNKKIMNSGRFIIKSIKSASTTEIHLKIS